MDRAFWWDWAFANILTGLLLWAPQRMRPWLIAAIGWCWVEMIWHGLMEWALGQVLLFFCPY